MANEIKELAALVLALAQREQAQLAAVMAEEHWEPGPSPREPDAKLLTDLVARAAKLAGA